MVKLPSLFHLNKITLNARSGLHDFKVVFQVRDIMRIHRLLKSYKNTKYCDKIENFLNSYAQQEKFYNFKITDNITIGKIGVNDDD